MAACKLTAELCKTWEKIGKQTFMKSCKAILASQTNGTIDECCLHQHVHSLCWQVILGNLKTDAAVGTIKELIDVRRSISSLVADVLSIIDIEVSCSHDKEQHDNFIHLLSNLQGSVISEAILRERLDPDTCEASGLLTSKALFQQKLVKVKTKLYYKQNKFNLLREESEGYSKLITELNQDISGNITPEALIENVKSLIGVFYLDPNRVLDILLESFELRPNQEAFFVPIIRSYAAEQKTICHILGFKFHFYETTTVDQTPASLYKVAALLLKNGLVQLDDLYSHLAPTDHNMADHHKNALSEAKTYERKMTVVILSDKTEEKEAEVESMDDINENNQKLGLIGALLEVGDWHNARCIMDRLPPFYAAAYEPVATKFGSFIHSIELKNEINQKLGLIGALLEVGDWHNARCIMDRLPPFYAAAYEPVATKFGSLIHSAIEHIYSPNENNQKLGLIGALLEVGDWHNARCIMDRLPPFYAAAYEPVATKFGSLIHSAIEPLYKRNTCLPEPLVRRRKKPAPMFAGLEAAVSFSDLTKLVFPMLSYLGPHIHYDVPLLVKLIRLGRSFMIRRRDGLLTSEDDLAYFGFLTVLDEVLLPSLSLLPCNCCLSEELWGLLRLLPYEIRYRLYGHWKNETYSLHPKLIRVRADTLDRGRYILKRLSKENVKPSGRQLGKISHSNPGIVFEYVLTQIQRYDNFIIPVVDSLKYLTSLSYDMLAYCIIEALANPERERLKHDDTNISLWLQSLANFAGTICRKYQVELIGLMQYVANQLKAGKSFDLLILREVVQKMAGIEISEEMTYDQLIAMSGGEMLRQEGGYFAQVRNTKKSSNRLKEALMDKNLDVSLSMLMAQQRDSVVYKEGVDRHLKLSGKLYDQCQDTLVQFGSFLSMQLSAEEFNNRLPKVADLIENYHVPPDAAFFLSRNQYTHGIYLKYDELKTKDKEKEGKTSSSQKMVRFRNAFEHIMDPIVETILPLFPASVWHDLSAKFFVIFWSLCDYDLAVPTSAYDKQIQHLKSQISHSDEMSETKKKKEKERCGALCDKLNEEQKKQSDHVMRVRSYLEYDKESWFLSRASKNETITQFLQLCVFPRCCFTATDAMYCAKFIRLLHDLKTPNFSTLICCDRIFCEITHCVTSCTENEAHRYGRFLCACLDHVMHWHSTMATYDKECAAYPGFVTVFRKNVSDINSTANQLDYENYRHVVHKWHFRMTKAVVNGLESNKFIQIRNSIIILTKILPHYPRIVQFGQAVQRRIEKLVETEKEGRQDLYVLALGYSGQLKGRKPTWVQEAAFHLRDAKSKDATSLKKEAVHEEKKEGKDGETTKKEIKKEPKSSLQFDGVTSKTPKEKERSSEKKKEKTRKEKEVKIKIEDVKVKQEVITDEEEERQEVERRTTDKTEKGHRSSSKGHHRADKEREERASSAASGSSPGPPYVDSDDRDVKRRKLEPVISKETTGHSTSRDKQSASPPAEREREKKERKRDRSKDPADAEVKKPRNDAGRLNGTEETDEAPKKKSGSPEKHVKSSKSSKKDKDSSEPKVKKPKKDKDRNKEEKSSHSAKKSRKSHGDE